MKDEMVGGSQELLLWPVDMSVFAIPKSSPDRDSVEDYATPIDTLQNSSDLLWPASLINEQARISKQGNNTVNILAIIIFIASCAAGIIIGPLLLAVIAGTNDYTWTTTVFYASLMRVILLISGLLAIMNVVILALLYRQPSLKQRTILALVAGSLGEIGLIWLCGYFMTLTPPQLMLALLLGAVILTVIILFISKQYVARPDLSAISKIIIGIFIAIATLEVGLSGYYLVNSGNLVDNSEIERRSTAQAEARLDGVAAELSNLVYTLCDGKYNIVYLSEFTSAGLFECDQSGEVYSVAEDTLTSKNPTGGATYLGTTKDPTVTLYFSNSYYLYRSLPQVLSEDELVLMLPAASEQELVDNLAPMLLSYWQDNGGHNLYLNVFYNPDINQIESTKDYILVSALGTMVMAEGLPKGLSLRGVADGVMTDYLFHADMELAALNELGGAPDLYAASTREALMTNRHISLHLEANELLDEETLVAKLWDSFTGGI